MRLTDKIEMPLGYGYIPKPSGKEYEVAQSECVDKLGQLEDIEDELGIDLITLFKALKNGFYFKDNYGDIDFISGNIIRELNKTKLEELKEKINEYGKTWALTKEELL